MIKLFIVAAGCALFCLSGYSQSYIGISTGIGRDINNNHEAFYHVPVTLRWKPGWSNYNPFVMEVNYDIPFTGNRNVNAYTLNPLLPQMVQLQEQVRPYVFTGSIGMGLREIVDKERNDLFYFNFLMGVCNQYFRVRYEHYDSKNYEVLDPDVNVNLTSMVFTGEAIYKFHNNMIVMLRAQTPLLFGYNGKYPLSYTNVAPLQLSFGYNFYYNKGHDDTGRRRRRKIKNHRNEKPYGE
jgi:hypothetical protein